jgi:hypothetical protein
MISLSRNIPKRRKCPLCVSVDHDADDLLRAMAPTSKGFGQLLSELIRKEARERAERPALLAKLAALAEGGAEQT